MNRKYFLEEYYNYLKGRRQYKPTTTAEKLIRLSMAIGFVIHENADHQNIYIRGSQLRDIIKQWVKSLAKSITTATEAFHDSNQKLTKYSKSYHIPREQ